MEFKYDINQFHWNNNEKTFYADAWGLVAEMPDGTFHTEAFPNMKKQFFIHNYKTKGFRRFTFVKEEAGEPDENGYTFLDWIFESEDEIKCRICVQP